MWIFKKKHNTRELALQIIYSWYILKTKKNIKLKIKEFKLFKKEIFKNIDIKYLFKIIYGIQKNYKYIRKIIFNNIYASTKYIGNIEISILYMSIYEFKIRKNLHYKVIINESILLAKKFGSYNSYKLINKILDNIINNNIYKKK